MIRVRTASRLHFGFLSLPSVREERWPNLLGEEVLPARHFGGVGLMVRDPGIDVTAVPASTWSAEGPLAERALSYARRFAQSVPPGGLPALRLVVEHSAAAHSGLGTGTQLALAVAQVLALAAGQKLDASELARRVGRGSRSALGVHGFAQGGFLVEGGKHSAVDVAPLVARADFPDPWRVVLVLPDGLEGRHGLEEQQAFQRLTEQDRGLARTDTLCRLVLLGMLPALTERDLPAFGEALYDFNVRVGEAFSPVQGGRYASKVVADLVGFIRQQGVPGVGQSSWGQAVFAVVGDPARGQDLTARIRDRFNLTDQQAFVTEPVNRGVEIFG
jgi:beta-RFAP synthase